MHQLQLLDRLPVNYQGQARFVELYRGDLTDLPPAESVDFLVVSALRGSYAPVKGTLIKALSDKGISVADLALSKSEDLTSSFSCWLSEDIQHPRQGIQFKRLLVFEPEEYGEAPEVVGEIFQSLIPFLSPDQPAKVAMPLVSTGSVKVPVPDMLEPLIDAAVNWMSLGLPVEQLMIVEISELKAMEMKGAFSILKRRYQRFSRPHRHRYDIFVSYCQKNMADADFLIEELQRQQQGVRIFVDRKELNTGAAWQQQIFEALDDCARVVSVYSPQYLESKVCKEEFNIALYRHREAGDILLPVYLYTADLPTYMKVLQYVDCREADRDKLRSACQEILRSLR